MKFAICRSMLSFLNSPSTSFGRFRIEPGYWTIFLIFWMFYKNHVWWDVVISLHRLNRKNLFEISHNMVQLIQRNKILFNYLKFWWTHLWDYLKKNPDKWAQVKIGLYLSVKTPYSIKCGGAHWSVFFKIMQNQNFKIQIWYWLVLTLNKHILVRKTFPRMIS